MSANEQVTDVAVYESYDTTKAKQKANRDYADMVGVHQQLKIIKILTVVAVVFGMASIVSSSFGFYYDFIQVLGAYTVWVAIVLGVTIETLKVVSIWGAFADWNGNVIIKGSFVVLLILFTTLALVLHFRGLTNYETVTVKDTISQVRTDALAITKQREARADKLTDLNIKAVNTVLTNGVGYDDAIVVKSMKQNNKTIASLRSTGEISEVDLMYIEQQKKSSKTMKNALGVVFPIIELLAVLGVFIMFLKKYSTSSGVREFISNREKMNDMEANYFDMVNQTMREDFMRKMRDNYNHHSNTSGYSQQNKYGREVDFSTLPKQVRGQLTAEIQKVLDHYYTMAGTHGANTRPINKDVFMFFEYQGLELKSIKLKNVNDATADIIVNVPLELFTQFQEAKKTQVEHQPVEEFKRIENKESPYKKAKDEVEELETEVEEPAVQVRSFDIEAFTPTQKNLLRIAFKNGNTKPGEFLLTRREILKKAKELGIKSPQGALTSLLADLYEYGYVSIESGGQDTYYCVKPLATKDVWTNL